jgi:hypothetical protein
MVLGFMLVVMVVVVVVVVVVLVVVFRLRRGRRGCGFGFWLCNGMPYLLRVVPLRVLGDMVKQHGDDEGADE